MIDLIKLLLRRQKDIHEDELVSDQKLLKVIRREEHIEQQQMLELIEDSIFELRRQTV